jgi:L-iditol 2-dehydrogenase
MGWNVFKFPLPPGYPGHEGVGEVIDPGNTDFDTKELVLTVPNIWKSQAFAEYQLIDPKYLIKLPADLPISHLLMAQQLGTVVYGCKQLPSVIGKTVVVIGQGSVGLFHNFMLKQLGADKIITIEPIPERRIAGEKMGINESIDLTGDPATKAVLDLTNGQGADITIEAVGSTETLNQSIKVTKPLGRIAAFGLPTTMEYVPFDWNNFFRKKLTMHSVHGSQDEPGLPDFHEALDLIVNGKIDMSQFLTHKFHISEIQKAFDLANSKKDGAIKITIDF